MTIINTHKDIKKLMEVGLSEKQSEAFITALYTFPVNTLNVFRDLVKAGYTESQAEILAQTIFAKYN